MRAISSRMAPRPASNAALSWADVSSRTSLPRPRYSCARTWASPIRSWARRAQSAPFSRRSSRVSSPRRGASRSATPAPISAPTVSSPSAPRKSRSPRSSLIPLLLPASSVREPLHEHVDAPLHPPGEAERPPDGPEAPEERREARQPRHHLLGHDHDALDLPQGSRGLLGQLAVLLEEGLDLRGERPDLALDRGQGLLRGARRPGQLHEHRDRRQ